MAEYPPTAKVVVGNDRVVKVVVGRPRPYYSRGGTKRLEAGSVIVTVTFNTELRDANWVFAGLTFWNSADAVVDTVQLSAMGKIQKSASGFQLVLSGPPPTDNYYMDWSIAESYDP